MEKWKLADPYPGAHIRVKTGSFYHHGIYIGNDEVVQFGYPFNYTQDPKSVIVVRSSIFDFLKGGFLEVKEFSHKEKKQKYSDSKIIENALSHLGEAGYNILNNNCEHFVNLCIFGKKISYQTEQLHKDIKKKLNDNNI